MFVVGAVIRAPIRVFAGEDSLLTALADIHRGFRDIEDGLEVMEETTAAFSQ